MVDVWDVPLRLIHWILVAAVLIAYFSANIFDTVHEIAGYTVMALIVFRVVWGFIGTRYSLFSNSVRPLRSVLRFSGADRAAGSPAAISVSIRLEPRCRSALLASLAVSTISGWMQITEKFFGVDWVETIHTVFVKPGDGLWQPCTSLRRYSDVRPAKGKSGTRHADRAKTRPAPTERRYRVAFSRNFTRA